MLQEIIEQAWDNRELLKEAKTVEAIENVIIQVAIQHQKPKATNDPLPKVSNAKV